MSNSESTTEEVFTEEETSEGGSDKYSSDFEETQWQNSYGSQSFTQDGKSQSSLRYSSDFESTALTGTLKPTFSALTPRPRPKPRKSINVSLTRSYSEDFDTESPSARTNGAGTPTLADIQTARSGYTLTYTDNIGNYSRTPRKAVRARSLEIITARSASKLGYSDDFESVSKTVPSPRFSARYSTDTFAGYTESFESDSDEALTVGSSESTDHSIWTQGSSSEAVIVTDRSFSDSSESYTYTQATTEPDTSYYETPQMRRIADSARRQFILQKLNVLRDTTLQNRTPTPTRIAPDRYTGSFCRKKIKALKKKLKEESGLEQAKDSIEGSRYHLREKDERTVESFGINPAMINKLKAENTLGRMKKMANEEIHIPSECPACIAQATEIAQIEFAARKKTLVQSKAFDEQISESRYKYGDSVALAGEGVKELPSYQTGSAEIFKQLLRPWSFQVWGSKILKEEEERAEMERTTIKDDMKKHNEIKPVSKPSLVCPHLAEFRQGKRAPNRNKDTKESAFKPRVLYTPLFDDTVDCDKSTLKTSNNNIHKNRDIFSILCDKIEDTNVNETESQVMSPRKADESFYPEGGAWEDIKDELDECASTAVPAVSLHEKLPLGLDIPEDREAFWKHYFAPLKKCAWFPKTP